MCSIIPIPPVYNLLKSMRISLGDARIKRTHINSRLMLSAYLYFLLTRFESGNIIPHAVRRVILLCGIMLEGGILSYQHFNPL